MSSDPSRAIKGRFVMFVDSKVGENTVIWHYVNIYNSEIGANCKIASHVEIGGSKIGANCKIEAFTFISPGTKIGNNVFLGPRVSIANDKYPNADPFWNMGGVTIEDNVSVGMGAIILPGVTIGKGSFIAAGSLVSKNVGPNSFAMGSPAHVVSRDVFDKVENRLP
jgi:UDP-2-acetamido-3-amino-2,3-dideoxy-glucuronate N-acetyltransferase